MILIVEGMDRCGKDTLIKHLRKTYFKSPKTMMLHCVSPPNESSKEWALDHYTNILDQVNKMSMDGWNVILNRSHLGEDVYGPIYRTCSAPWVYDLDSEYLNQSDTLLVTLIDNHLERLADRDDGDSLSSNIHDMNRVLERFSMVHGLSNIKNKVLYDFAEQAVQSLDEMLNIITAKVKYVGEL